MRMHDTSEAVKGAAKIDRLSISPCPLARILRFSKKMLPEGPGEESTTEFGRGEEMDEGDPSVLTLSVCVGAGIRGKVAFASPVLLQPCFQHNRKR